MYDATAESYAKMMDSEIDLPIYADVMARLRARIEDTPGTLIDTSCGSGHMLSMYHERYDQDWQRVLRPGGQLLVATWEGTGAIDYGDESDIMALRYRPDELESTARSVGFTVMRCIVEPVEDMPMDAIYLEATRD